MKNEYSNCWLRITNFSSDDVLTTSFGELQIESVPSTDENVDYKLEKKGRNTLDKLLK